VPLRNDGHCLEVDRYRLPGRRHTHVSYWLDGAEMTGDQYHATLLSYEPTRQAAQTRERQQDLGMAGSLSGGVALISSIAGAVLCRDQACLAPTLLGMGIGLLLSLVSGLFGMNRAERSEDDTELFNDGSGGCRRLKRD
jgi:hypothetical protein